MSSLRRAHDEGDCWPDRCTYCAAEEAAAHPTVTACVCGHPSSEHQPDCGMCPCTSWRTP